MAKYGDRRDTSPTESAAYREHALAAGNLDSQNAECQLQAELEANLQRTPAERIAELVRMNRLHADIQSRTLTLAQQERLRSLELEQARERVLPDDIPR